MVAFAIRRALFAIPILLCVVSIVFFAMRLVPGDPAEVRLGEHATAEAIRALRLELGLDRPLWAQYVTCLRRVLTGDLGRSVITDRPIASEISRNLPYTIDLAIGSTIIGLLLGLPIGILSALKPNSILDYVTRTLALAGLSAPAFYLGVILLYLLSLRLDLFPVIGGGDLRNFGDRLYHLFLPSLSLGLIQMSFVMRITRSSMLDIINEDYVKTARAKGLREMIVLMKHALRNALIPIATAMGLYFGTLLGGTVLTETVFSRPGIGKLIVGAIQKRDYTTLQSGLMIFAGFVVFVNLFVDLLYGYIDPTIRYD